MSFIVGAGVAGRRPGVATSDEVEGLIAGDAPVAVGVSGGKDSQAAALATYEHLDAVGHAGPRLLVHSDLGPEVEWEDSLPTCRRLADHLGTELVVIEAGSMMERWERRWQSSKDRYAGLETVTVVPPWSTPTMRFCTSEKKTKPIQAMLRRRFAGPVVNVTGVRRDESANRAKGAVHDVTDDGRVWNWRPLSDWDEGQVFGRIAESGLRPHQAYREYGMSRVSCRFCIMSSGRDLTSATGAMESWTTYRRMVALEVASTFGFQGGRWLGDVSPHLLTLGQAEGVADAKRRAAARREVEAGVTKAMLYVKGWPTRVLDPVEAAILAGVRARVGAILGLECGYLDVGSIRERYAGLIAEREAREAERRAVAERGRARRERAAARLAAA